MLANLQHAGVALAGSVLPLYLTVALGTEVAGWMYAECTTQLDALTCTYTVQIFGRAYDGQPAAAPLAAAGSGS